MKTDKRRRLILLSMVALLSWHTAYTQIPFLERTMTIALSQDRLDVALKKISRQGGFTFSYSPSILEAEKIVTYNFVNKTVREILDQLFNGTLQYKARGKYIILTKAQLSSSRESQVFSGYVVDEATGERLKDVTVYDPVTLSSTLTNSYGYFEIKVDNPPPDLRLAINKKNYTDTLLVAPPKNGKLLNIPMKVNTEKITTFADSVGKKLKRFWKTKVMAHLSNVSDTLHRKSQLSLVPFLGTNHALSGNVINDYSFNVVGGYSLGVRKMELGGVFNIVLGDVQGLQMAGVFNASGGNVKGAQFAGVFNANEGTMHGAQLAGVFNFNWEGAEHFAAAGVFNFSRQGSRAVQLAGVGNITLKEQKSPHLAGLFNFSSGNAKSQAAGCYNFTAGSLNGWQTSGVVNFAGKEVLGAQTAGVLNFAGKNVSGGQVAGVLNFAGKEVHGVQMAGVLNFAGKIKGVQVAPVFNYATKVNGVQLALVNISDSVRGVPIGLLSFVLKGYHKLEVSADELFYTNVALRTGVRQFYNIVTAGAKPSTFSDTSTLWTFGYGVGTAPRLSKKLFLNVDITSNQIAQGNTIEKINLLNKLYLGVDYQFVKGMSLTAGLTLNAYITDNTFEGYPDIFKDFKPHLLSNHDYGHNKNMKMWIGGKIGLRFF